jgi:hypothetical protein
VSYGGREVQ